MIVWFRTILLVPQAILGLLHDPFPEGVKTSVSVYPALDFYYPSHRYLGVVQPGQFFFEIRLAAQGVEACGESAYLFSVGECIGYFSSLPSGKVQVYSTGGVYLGETGSKLVAARTLLDLLKAQRKAVLPKAS